jgi:predicted O-methyltransferase YrrM
MIHPAYSDPQLLEWTLDLSKQFNLKTFCETGTYHGGTAQIVSQYFDKIITIENNIDFYNIAKNTLQNTPVTKKKQDTIILGSQNN